MSAEGDLTTDASESVMNVPRHDVLFAGFPCQPFSKGGFQRGMAETRGTLFWNIARVLEARKPKLVVLENVRNLTGPRHKHEWDVIVRTLRELGYRVSDAPLITSPHKLPPSHGGRPQSRERLYISATYVPPKMRKHFGLEATPITLAEIEALWSPDEWDLRKDLKMKKKLQAGSQNELALTEDECLWIDTWDDFVLAYLEKNKGERLPGFPLWADVWTKLLKPENSMPVWKINFIRQNRQFYDSNKTLIDSWIKRNPQLKGFPNSRRKLEWQAQSLDSIWSGAIQLRPSGIRVKRATYVPAIVAMTQTSIYGPYKRRLSVSEVAVLQGLPESFSFAGQSKTHSYRQLGNGISVGSAYQAVMQHVIRDREILDSTSPEIVNSIIRAPASPIL